MIFTLEKFERFASQCPAGWRAAALAVAKVTPDSIELPAETFASLQARFWPDRKPPVRGLGDVIARVATPVARVLGLGCIDPATQQLRPESGCAQRQADYNRRFPFSSRQKQPAIANPPSSTPMLTSDQIRSRQSRTADAIKRLDQAIAIAEANLLNLKTKRDILQGSAAESAAILAEPAAASATPGAAGSAGS